MAQWSCSFLAGTPPACFALTAAGGGGGCPTSYEPSHSSLTSHRGELGSVCRPAV